MRYSDIIPDYQQYKDLQIGQYQSFESEVPRWRDPQIEVVQRWFKDLPLSWRILDCACGDGVALQILHQLGFGEVTGVELSADKGYRASRIGYIVYQQDAHDLKFPDASFDLVYSSHTLEHCYYPGQVLDEFRRVLVSNGYLYVILPYPDNGVDQAHGGKYELGTERSDGLVAFTNTLYTHGFEPIDGPEFGYRDGPEVRVRAKRIR